MRSAKWCPSRHTLAICTGNHHVYLWSPEVRKTKSSPVSIDAVYTVVGVHGFAFV